MLKKIVIVGVTAGVTMLGAAGLAYAEPLSDSDNVNSDNESSHSVDSDSDNMLNTDSDTLSTDSDDGEDSILSGLDLGSL